MKILLVDDHKLFREGLVSLLDQQLDMKVIAQASSVREAIALSRSLRPDIVLMDFSLPDGDGVEATQAIMADLPTAKIVFLTVHDDDTRLFAALRGGAIGYLFKNVRSAELLKTLRGVARGEAGLTRLMALRLVEEFSRLPAAPDVEPFATSELTKQEINIVHELERGATNREIAEKFHISENTVKNHVRSVLAKLRLHSRRDVSNYVRRLGLTRSFASRNNPPS